MKAPNKRLRPRSNAVLLRQILKAPIPPHAGAAHQPRLALTGALRLAYILHDISGGAPTPVHGPHGVLGAAWEEAPRPVPVGACRSQSLEPVFFVTTDFINKNQKNKGTNSGMQSYKSIIPCIKGKRL